MAYKLGFIGAGNMAQAIFRRLLQTGTVAPQDLYISDVLPELTASLAGELGLGVAPGNRSLAEIADVVVLAVKPVFCRDVLADIRDALGEKPLLSIVSGWTLPMLQAALQPGVRLLCVMPNTPAMVGEGMTLLGTPHTLDGADFARARALFEAVGTVAVVEDRLFAAAGCISGCGPAFIYQCVEAMGDAGVLHGLPRTLAYQLAAQTVLGAGKMALQSGSHPAALKDAVCSPGGTTIRGIYAMEKAGVRAALMDAVSAAYEKTTAVEKQLKD
ncbi:MAG: pyrroline-5-carboxylate reductase [Oscillospiraceae bacterium]|nr:pyrroline-5-carboxylate reductase [Oscillospiraceae bacterium]